MCSSYRCQSCGYCRSQQAGRTGHSRNPGGSRPGPGPKSWRKKEWLLPSGAPFNFVHRPGLLRILRNTDIRCILPARVTGIKHSPQGFRIRIQQPANLCGSRPVCLVRPLCAEVCPVRTPDAINTHPQFGGRHAIPGRPVILTREKNPCANPTVRFGRQRSGLCGPWPGPDAITEALECGSKETTFFPASAAGVCTHPL